MVATVIINEKNAVGEVATDKTAGTVRYKRADNSTVDLVDPIVVPTAATAYSFEKWLRLNAAGAFTQLTNVGVYMDGAKAWAAGVKLWGLSVAAFVTPADPSTAVDPPQHAATPLTDLFLATSVSPMSLGAGPFTVAGDFGNYLISILEVEIGSAPGVLPGETMTFVYDEI